MHVLDYGIVRGTLHSTVQARNTSDSLIKEMQHASLGLYELVPHVP
jgi:hypothetical protein